MAAEFPSKQEPSVRGGVVASERVYVDAEGNRVSSDSSVSKRLYAPAGATLSESEAHRLGVTDSGVAADNDPVSTSEDTSEADEPTEGSDDEGSLVCDECGFEAKSAAGLGAHQRTHGDAE